MRRAITVVFATALAWTWACGTEPATQPPSEAVSVVFPMAAFDATVFDTITWSSEADYHERGRAVFSTNCQRCHGPTGAGDGGYMFGGESLQPPSWLVLDWPLATQPIALRAKIYGGSVGGMPYWGLAGVSHRDIDAVANYIVEVLRPTFGDKPVGG